MKDEVRLAELEDWAKGEVTCPRCGRPGKLSIRRFRSKGHTYTYKVVVHKVVDANGHKRTKYCILRPIDEGDYFQKFLIRPYGKSSFLYQS